MLTLYNLLITFFSYGLLIHLTHSPFRTYFGYYVQFIFSLQLKLDKSLVIMTRTSNTGSANESKRVGWLAGREGGKNLHALHVQICPLLSCEVERNSIINEKLQLPAAFFTFYSFLQLSLHFNFRKGFLHCRIFTMPALE